MQKIEVIFPKEKIDYCGRKENRDFKDIFGENHFFFRQYKIWSKDFYTMLLPMGFCFPNQEFCFRKDKSIVPNQTSYRIHPLTYTGGGGKDVLRNLYVWIKKIKTSIFLLFSKKIKGNVALLRRDVEDCYGHAIADVVIGFILVKEYAKRKNIEIDYYIFPTKKTYHRELAQILGIPQDKIISTDNKRPIQASNLLVPSLPNDYEFVEYRKYLHARPKYPIYFLSDFYNLLIPKKFSPKNKIFLRRPKESNRNIVNAEDVEDVFLDFGYQIVYPDQYSLIEQIEIFQQAKCIASMHGSGLDNVLFAHDEIYIFEIFSEFYHDSSPMNKCISKKCHYYYMIGKTKDRSMHPQQESVYVEIDRLRIALKMLEIAMKEEE